MLKQVLSALAITGVMLSSAAFAADQPTAAATPTAQPSQTQTATATTKSGTVEKKAEHKVAHKHMKATTVKTEPGKTTTPAPVKSN